MAARPSLGSFSGGHVGGGLEAAGLIQGALKVALLLEGGHAGFVAAQLGFDQLDLELGVFDGLFALGLLLLEEALLAL
jgi:hypothetical protein